jgi:hypothetical protein
MRFEWRVFWAAGAGSLTGLLAAPVASSAIGIGSKVDWNALWSSLVGALVGSALTLVATYVSHSLISKATKEKEEMVVQGMLQALRSELEALWGLYESRIGHAIEALPAGEPFEFEWRVQGEYFTVYHSIAGQLGSLRDTALRTKIILTYGSAKSLIDSFRTNNGLLQDYQAARSEARNAGQNLSSELVNGLQALKDYALLLRQSHSEFKQHVGELHMMLCFSESSTKKC